MNINFMRKVDYWVGVPLTSVVTLIAKPLQLLRPRAVRENVRNVLFIELSEMGSAILADAALKKVSSAYEVYFVIFKKNAISLQLLKTVPPHRVFCIREDSLWTLAMDCLRFVVWCRKHKIHASVDLELFSRVTALLSFLSGAFFRIGYIIPNGEGLYRGNLLTHEIAYNSHLHISKNFITLVDPLFLTYGQSPYVKRQISSEEVRFPLAVIESDSLSRMKKIIQAAWPSYTDRTEIILVNVNAGDLLPQRRWHLARFEELCRKILAQHPHVLILLTGSKSERSYVNEVASAVRSDNCVNFAGHVVFEDLPALYSLSRLIVTNDSGPAHFASAVGLNTFVLFGPETPLLYGPLQNTVSITAGLACSPCVTANNHRNTACRNNICMKSISADFVFKLVQEYLSSSAKDRNVKVESRVEICNDISL